MPMRKNSTWKIAAVSAALFSTTGIPSPAQETFTRQQVIGAVAELQKIVTVNGVQEQLQIPVGGTKQWISVRGRNRRNPILLVIHGV